MLCEIGHLKRLAAELTSLGDHFTGVAAVVVLIPQAQSKILHKASIACTRVRDDEAVFGVLEIVVQRKTFYLGLINFQYGLPIR